MIERLDEAPGVDRRMAEAVLAEVGVDMEPFPSDQHLASWAGMCSGNEESAGKRRRRRITPGNRWPKRTLTRAAWAVSHTKNTYLASQCRCLAGRQGKKTGRDCRGPFDVGDLLPYAETEHDLR